MRQSKYDPLVEEVEVLHANPQYVHVRLPSGVESTVSIRDLAPVAAPDAPTSSAPEHSSAGVEGTTTSSIPPAVEETVQVDITPSCTSPVPSDESEALAPPAPPAETSLRRSSRTTKKPVRLIEELCGSIGEQIRTLVSTLS